MNDNRGDDANERGRRDVLKAIGCDALVLLLKILGLF